MSRDREATFEKRSDKIAPKRRKHTFPVWVVVRHTRSGDERISVIDQYHYSIKDPEDQRQRAAQSREHALEEAREVANEAAAAYGHGAASVYAGTLTIHQQPEKP